MKLNRYILQWLSGAAISLITGLAITGCTDDIGGDFGEKELGKKVKGTVSVNFGTTSPTTASRVRTDFDPDASIKIDSYWVGLFDTQTGELIGTKYDTYPRKSNDTRWTLDNDDSQNPFVVEDIDLYYYDNNPEAYIVGVINFNDVEGKNAGDSETKPLIDLLNEVKYFEDVCKISVDVKTAEAANSKSGNNGDVPVMMGFYTTERTTEHTTVTNDGKVSQDAVKIRLANAGGADLNIQPGAVRLQRLMAEMNIIVVGSSPITKPVPVPGGSSDYPSSYPPVPVYPAADSYLQITNLEYKVVNSPAEVFLAEHPTDRNAYAHTSEKDYLANTANSADYSGAYLDYPTYMTGNSASEGWTKVYSSKVPTGPSEGAPVVDMYFFRYQHYENKHWGSRDMTQFGRDNHSRREAKWDSKSETPVFKSLCPSEDQSWNNNASYIVLKADIVIRDASESETTAFEGTVYYTIHEGYSRSMNSGAANVGDFETVRNTSYYYVISIAGIDQLLMNVGYADFGKDPDNAHNDGISGQLTGESFIMVAPNPDPKEDIYEYVLPPMTNEEKAKKLKFAYGVPTVDFDQKTPEGEPTISFTLYGNLESSDSELLERLPPILSESYEYDIKGFGDMPDNVKESVIFIPMVDGTRPMTITDYLEAEEVYDEAPIAVRFTAYEENVKNLDYVSARFFMFNVDGYMSDADGCSSIDEFYKVYVQPPIDNRAELQCFAPSNQSFTFNNTQNDIDFNVYSAVKGMSDIDYIRWWAGAAEYSSDEPTIPWNDSPFNGEVHEPLSYTVIIDDKVVKTIERSEFEQYRHDSKDYHLSPQEAVYYYEIPYNIDELSEGDHTLRIEVKVNNQYVKPVAPIETTLRIVERPYWKFDNNTFPILGNNVSGYYSYAGMTASYVPIYSAGYAEVDGGAMGSSYDNNVLRFTINKFGKFKVTARNNNGSSDAGVGRQRRITLMARGSGSTSSAPIVYGEGEQVVYLNTRDLIDNFENGPIDVAISSNFRLQIYEIEWIPDSDQRPGLDTSYFAYTNQSGPETSRPSGFGSLSHVMHPYNNYQYLDGNLTRFYIIPGFVTYLGFTDSNPRAEKYRVGIYESINASQPLFTQEFEADKYRSVIVSTNNNTTGYFAVPLYVPEGKLDRDKFYAIAVTPVDNSSQYAPGTPHFLSPQYSDDKMFSKVIADMVPDWSYNPETGFSNPWKGKGWIEFENFENEFCDYYGLVIHGGTGYMYMNDNSIVFNGSGYPIESKQTGRYLSFAVDRPGRVEITAQGGGSTNERCFRLYNTKKGLGQSDYIGRRVFGSNQRVTLSMGTGAISELTEFIICPEGGINLYSIKFVASDDPSDYGEVKDDTREVLDNSAIKYSAGTTHINDNGDDYSITITPNVRSYVSIFDNTPNVEDYKLQLFRIKEGGDLEAYEEDWDIPYMTTFSEEGIKSGDNIYTFPIMMDKYWENEKFAIFVTPIGDEQKYQPAKPKRLSVDVHVSAPATSDSPLVWFDNTSPFNGWEGINTVGAICEYNGLVLHGGGSNGITINNTSLTFARHGYPINGLDRCGYISFTTSKPGKIIVKTDCNGATPARYMYIYNANNTSKEIDKKRTLYGQKDTEIELRTGAVDEPTEFIICPENSQNIYAIKFVPTDYPWEYTPLDEDPNEN